MAKLRGNHKIRKKHISDTIEMAIDFIDNGDIKLTKIALQQLKNNLD